MAKRKRRPLCERLDSFFMRSHELLLRPIAPFRLDLTAWVLRRRRHNIVDQFENGIYRRVLNIDSRRIGISMRQAGSDDKPLLHVKVSSPILKTDQEKILKRLIEKLLGIKTDLNEFYKFSARDKNLGPVVKKCMGFKPPQFVNAFEAAVNGICCQQLSLAVGIHLLNRLTRVCSEPVDNDDEMMYAFPEPAEMAELKVGRLLKLGFSQNKAKALIELARDITETKIDLDKIEALDDEAAIAELCKLQGIGRWTAEYVLLRGLGRIHIYPGNDIGLQNGLKRWLKLEGKVDYNIAREVMSDWRPYGGMVYFHMLMERLNREGLIQV
jgi:DNA-3-methyladenine glycosylase II